MGDARSDQSESTARKQMIEALLSREGLLPLDDWPWTDDELREAMAKIDAAFDEDHDA